MGGSISRLHRLRNRFLVKAEGTLSLFDKQLGEGGALSSTEFEHLFGQDSISIFLEVTSEFQFPSSRIPVDLVVDFLKLGRIPFKRLPPKTKHPDKAANSWIVGKEQTALVPKIHTTIQK
jgi:hypothetical protein